MFKSERGCRKQGVVLSAHLHCSLGLGICIAHWLWAFWSQHNCSKQCLLVPNVPASNSSGYPFCQTILVGARPKPHGTQKFLLRLRVPVERFSISAQMKSTPKTDAKSGLWRVSFVCFRACFKTIKVTKAKCRREKQPYESRRLSSRSA